MERVLKIQGNAETEKDF